MTNGTNKSRCGPNFRSKYTVLSLVFFNDFIHCFFSFSWHVLCGNKCDFFLAESISTEADRVATEGLKQSKVQVREKKKFVFLLTLEDMGIANRTFRLNFKNCVVIISNS